MKTIEFRDGERDVPDHLASMMHGLRKWELTYEQAKAQAEDRMTRAALERAQHDLITAHFRDHDGTR
jgi:hypothetical protein